MILELLPELLVTAFFLLPDCAQFILRHTYRRYAMVLCQIGRSGADVTRGLLDARGLYHVGVERVFGELTDHYDPRRRVVCLSTRVYDGGTVAALAVAAHETGHALQHDERFAPLVICNIMRPAAFIGSKFGLILGMLGILTSLWLIFALGIILFLIAILSQIFTLPVEIDATWRALSLLRGEALLAGAEEEKGARKVLTAAAFTYAVAVLQIVFPLLRSLGRERG
ncbi:MAG: zinc metallopeptidase [Gracilibacteraceae bacterium]|jgi:Zn-dependent membrane protease YugP|nr:zinc metallopeptidase [Gracilibacteraceae bacterium]